MQDKVWSYKEKVWQYKRKCRQPKEHMVIQFNVEARQVKCHKLYTNIVSGKKSLLLNVPKFYKNLNCQKKL